MKMFKYISGAVFLCLSLVLTGCGGDSEPTETALHNIYTADGLTLKMLRYRPDDGSSFATGTPILLAPGITLNINQFDVRSPEGTDTYEDFELPSDAPLSAKLDPVIQNDPMRYYSLAHYLYKRGYDVWMFNYRGVGRDDFESERGKAKVTNLDVWCALDYPAAVDKVRAVTGKKPVIGGHSTGGLCAYLYLQGIELDGSVVAEGDYVPHVTSSATLAATRNSQVAGFLGLDPAGVPTLALEGLIDNSVVYWALGLNAYINLDALMPVVMSIVGPTVVNAAINTIFITVGALSDTFQDYLPGWGDLFLALDFWSVENMNKYTEDFIGRHAFSSFYLGGLAQYADWGINGVFREFWQNGEENVDNFNPGDRMPGDGYYYFEDNFSRMTVPAYSIFSESPGLVVTEIMVDTIYGGKTYNAKDEWIEMPGSGHVDIISGEHGPKIAFPAIADWLDAL